MLWSNPGLLRLWPDALTTRLDLILTRIDLIHSRVDLIHNIGKVVLKHQKVHSESAKKIMYFIGIKI
jgi:hypothetical protein